MISVRVVGIVRVIDNVILNERIRIAAKIFRAFDVDHLTDNRCASTAWIDDQANPPRQLVAVGSLLLNQ